MEKQSGVKLMQDFLWITLGSAVYALGFDWLYAPNQIGFGGITGVAQVINRFFPVLPIGVLVILINIPLFLLGWRLLGGKMLVTSLYAMAVSSVLMDLLAAAVSFSPMDPILAAVFGGVVLGLSLGIIFARGTTTGGTDLIARLLKVKFSWLPMGTVLMAVDLLVILIYAASFRSIPSAMYGIIGLYISTVVIDKVLYGMDVSKVAYIISDRSREVAAAIDARMDRGVTILHGEGWFTGQEKEVLMCAFKQKQIVDLKRIVVELDPRAFLIVCDAHDVLGEGFRRYQKDEI